MKINIIEKVFLVSENYIYFSFIVTKIKLLLEKNFVIKYSVNKV